MSSRRAAFTLIEICLALVIALLLVALAVPSISGLLDQQHLHASYEEFDRFVQRVRVRTLTEQRGYTLIFEQDGISLLPSETRETDDPQADFERFAFHDGGVFTLQRPAVLMKNPPDEWPFWRNGVCEPATVSFQGPAGTWTVQYDPLTAQSVFLDSHVP